jgi:HK97 family phage major capsid protein
MDFPALKEAQGKLDAARKGLADVFAQAGPELDVKKVKGIEGDVVEHIRAENARIEDLSREVEGLKAVARAAESVKGVERGDVAPADGVKDFGGLFVKSAAFGRKGATAGLDIELKTVMSTGAGWAPESTRTGLLVDSAVRPIQVTDLFPVGSTSQASVVYMAEDTITNAATEVAEAADGAVTTAATGLYPEQALSLSEVSEPVRKLAVWLPVTDEQLEDEAGVRGYINRRLPFLLRQRLDSQLLNGNGTAPNLSGLTDRPGLQTQAKGTDATPDAVYKAMTKVRVTGRANPSAVIMHPNDWQDIKLLRTADGVYIWGSPSEAGVDRIWGLPVVVADVQTENTAIVGDFSFCELYNRRGIDVQVTNSHASFFIEGRQAIRADLRVALAVYRPAAFATVTGI